MSRDELRLHPTKGVNPRVTACRYCGDDVGVALLGASDWTTRCDACGVTLVGMNKCPRCGGRARPTGHVPDTEKLHIETCDKCAAKIAEQRKVVEAGGVYWRCSSCNASGAIRASADVAKLARAQLNVPAPKPCGIEFDANDCPVCGKHSVVE